MEIDILHKNKYYKKLLKKISFYTDTEETQFYLNSNVADIYSQCFN